MKKVIFLFVAISSYCAFSQDRGSYNPHRINTSPEVTEIKTAKPNAGYSTRSGVPDVVEVSAENNCASAQVLTLNGGCFNGTTAGDNLEAWECTGDGFSWWRSTWYRFNTGANTSLNMAWIYTNNPACYPCAFVLGPFAPGTGCGGCSPLIANICFQNGDPGYHTQLTGLTTNMDYLINIQSLTATGCGINAPINYCIAMYTVPSNDPNPGTNLNNCGITFSGNNQGYSPDGTGTSRSNLDNNNATTCGTCAAGNDVPYVINNDQWFYFCTVNAGTYNITINNIANCVLSSPNAGIQCSILLGPTTAFTDLYDFPSPMAPGTSNTSSNFNLNAGDCIYLPIDGFAGDQCTYDFTLTNVSGGCLILPVELIKFDMKINSKEIDLFWETATEINNDVYIVQRSKDGNTYQNIGFVKSQGNTDVPTRYDFVDKSPNRGINYYRLLQKDKNGKTNELGNGIAKFYSDLSNDVSIYVDAQAPVINIELGKNFPMGSFTLDIYNVLGEKIKSAALTNTNNLESNFTLDISAFKSGIYSCTLSDDNATFVKKSFIKN